MPRQIPPIQNSFLCAKILVIANEVEQTSIAYFANAITNRFQNRRDTAAGWRLSTFQQIWLACVQGLRWWGGKGDGALARRQAD